MYSSAASSTRGNQRCEQATIISVTNNYDNDVVKQYQHQHHLVELNNTTSDNHPKISKSINIDIDIYNNTQNKR